MVAADCDILFADAQKSADTNDDGLWRAIRAQNYIVDGADIVCVVGWAVINGLADEVARQKLAGGGEATK